MGGGLAQNPAPPQAQLLLTSRSCWGDPLRKPGHPHSSRYLSLTLFQSNSRQKLGTPQQLPSHQSTAHRTSRPGQPATTMCYRTAGTCSGGADMAEDTRSVSFTLMWCCQRKKNDGGWTHAVKESKVQVSSESVVRGSPGPRGVVLPAGAIGINPASTTGHAPSAERAWLSSGGCRAGSRSGPCFWG